MTGKLAGIGDDARFDDAPGASGGHCGLGDGDRLSLDSHRQVYAGITLIGDEAPL